LDEWQYHPPPDIDETFAERLRNFPRQPYMLMYALRSLAALLLRGWMRVYHRLRIDGRRHLPETGSYVLVCNHTSHLDTLCLLCSVPIGTIHRTFPAAAADYFFCSLPRSAVSAVLINALPFDRELKGAESLAVCDRGRLVAGKDLPVLPCHLSGGRAAWPKGRLFPLPFRLHLRIAPARNYADLEPSAESVQHVCRDLQDRVARLGEEES
jgi:1-acyl-sn-glycerol-3-phosphate acyltransferase